jgi:hypothetical protein
MPEMIRCPGCPLLLPEDAFVEQGAHMLAEHPEMVIARMTEAHFTQDPVSGEWVDGWADE